MSRPYRIQIEDGFYHITSRGNDRKVIYSSQRDFEKFLEYLRTAKDKFKFYLHAYCLMSNHYHLFIETTQANLSRIMQYLNTSYSVYYNLKHKKTGHLFQGRYKSVLVQQDAYFAELTRYIHLNPVRANIVRNPAEYCWSSYKAYITNKTDSCVDIERVKQYLSLSLDNYRQFVETAEGCFNPLKNVYAGFILGGVGFIQDKLKQLRLEVKSKDFAYKRAVTSIIDPHEIIGVVANHYKVAVDIMISSISRPMTAKKTAIYLLHRRTGLTNAQIGAIFNMAPAAVSMAAVSLVREMVKNTELKDAVERLDFSFRV